MSIYVWVTLLIFIVYLALVNTANKTGWLDRRNMTLVAGAILMWRTQRGKELIEQLSGRATKVGILERRITNIRGQIEEAQEALEHAREEQSYARLVKEHWSVEDELEGLAPGDDEGEEREVRDDLAYKLKALEGQVSASQRFTELLVQGRESEVVVDEILDGAEKQQAELESTMSAMRLQLSDSGEQLAVARRDPSTERMERRAQRRLRLWRGYGNAAIAIVLLFMFLMFALLVWQSFIVVRIPPGVIKPQQMLGIPGVNPVIPLWYGIVGLAVAMFVHELAHGILSRAGNIVVKSLGLLFMVIPIGAFVEPDEEELAKVERGRRSRVFAVGPATNILVGLLVVLLFAWGFMGSLEQAEKGVVLNYIIDEQTITLEDGNETRLKTPASIAGLKPWSTLMSIEALTGEGLGPEGERTSVLKEHQDFLDTMGRSQGGQDVRLRWYHDGRYSQADVKLWDKGEVYGDEYSGQGYLGAGSWLIYEVPAGEYPKVLSRPLDYADDPMSFRNITFFYISLPFTSPSLQPPPPGVTQAFKVTGPLSVLGNTGFWVMSNVLYWVFWLNIMVGIFNALPAIPLDGGYIFRDGLSWTLERLAPGKKREAIDGMALRVTLGISLLILFLILFQFIGPSLGSALGL